MRRVILLFEGFQILGVALATLLATSSNATEKTRTPKGGLAEKIRGQVYLTRAGKMKRLASETPLRAGDWIDTEMGSQVTLVAPGMKLELSGDSFVEVTRGGNLALRYGQVLVHADPGKNSTLDLPTSVVTARGATYLGQVMRNEKQAKERIAERKVSPPTFAEAKKMADREDLYTWVACLEGDLSVRPKKTAAIRLRANEIMTVQGGAGDFAPTPVTPGEIGATVQALGFEGGSTSAR